MSLSVIMSYIWHNMVLHCYRCVYIYICTHMEVYMDIFIFICMQDTHITSHYITLPCIYSTSKVMFTLQHCILSYDINYTTLQYITCSAYINCTGMTLRCTTLHCITFRYVLFTLHAYMYSTIDIYIYIYIHTHVDCL